MWVIWLVVKCEVLFLPLVFCSLNTFQELIDSVRNTYKDYGASEDVINLEIEAFAVANSVSPATIATVIKELCRNQLTP